MARPQRNNVDYFPFYCEEGKKMYYLEETYGNDGFAVFIKILRELAKTDYHYLDLTKKTTLMFLSAKCKVTSLLLETIINDLVELEKFDRNLWLESRVIWCQDFIDSIQDAYNKRNNNCITYEGLLTLLISLGVRKPINQKPKSPVNPQTRIYKTKEEYRKTLLSDLKKSDFEDSTHFEITISFYELFKKNLTEAGASISTLEKATGKWIDQIRLMIETDKQTLDNIRLVFSFLQTNDFWKKNILSAAKLREKFNTLLLNSKENGKDRGHNKKQGATTDEIRTILSNHFD